MKRIYSSENMGNVIEIIFMISKTHRKWRMMGDKPAWFLITDKEIIIHLYNGETLINDLDMHPGYAMLIHKSVIIMSY